MVFGFSSSTTASSSLPRSSPSVDVAPSPTAYLSPAFPLFFGVLPLDDVFFQENECEMDFFLGEGGSPTSGGAAPDEEDAVGATGDCSGERAVAAEDDEPLPSTTCWTGRGSPPPWEVVLCRVAPGKAPFEEGTTVSPLVRVVLPTSTGGAGPPADEDDIVPPV